MGLAEAYEYYFNEMADQKTNSLPLMASPYIIPSIIFSYLYFVLKCGPEYMKNRKPYDLKTFVKFYNIFQITANAYVVYRIFSIGWFTKISIFCEHADYSVTPENIQLGYSMWLGSLLKLVDLIETGVFVLRKKNRQISFLHMYHHVSTAFFGWAIAKYVPYVMPSFTLMVNCSVHVIMYTYYFLSAYGPTMQRFLNPLKPAITIIQMVQFVVLILYNLQTMSPSCKISKWPGVTVIILLVINFILFFNFYRKNYMKPVKKTS